MLRRASFAVLATLPLIPLSLAPRAAAQETELLGFRPERVAAQRALEQRFDELLDAG